ncbi:hypothetical protein ASC61_10755 [Aeromicrobium sp. Root344]|uniref:DUF3298 domain-containing protein n=1 Tax=Aeromicrobium sp. Root344 TaxID=1736521 RepID=UPI0006FF9652|nr:DUF3298 domain-containing protein [Aeromicrobium sp. Root344]KQV75444.1 hypothetical protein ASC61_10755 [Aeromicrobium sp. Root344]
MTPTDLSNREIEELLTSALTARSAQIGADDLRTYAPLAEPQPRRDRLAPVRRIGSSRWIRPLPIAAMVATAAAFAVAIGGVPSIPGTSSPDTTPVAYVVTFNGGADENAHLKASFTPHDVPIDGGTKATSTYPLVVVTGGTPKLEKQVMDAANAKIVAEIDAYRKQLRALGLASRKLTQTITVRSDAQAGHAVSIVFDVVNDFGGAVPTSTSTAAVIDKRTGRAVRATDLFNDVPAVDRIMRRAIQRATQPAPATSEDLASLSMDDTTTGLTSPLTWYPTKSGLHWVVERGAVASDAQGEPAATVSWRRLAGEIAAQQGF